MINKVFKKKEEEIMKEERVEKEFETRASSSTLSQKKTMAVTGKGEIGVSMVSNGDVISIETTNYNTIITDNIVTITYDLISNIIVEDTTTAVVTDPKIDSVKDVE